MKSKDGIFLDESGKSLNLCLLNTLRNGWHHLVYGMDKVCI